MNTAEALLQAVLAQPGNALPKLILADYYEERGQDTLADLYRVEADLIDAKHSVKCLWAAVLGRDLLCPRCRLLKRLYRLRDALASSTPPRPVT
jgi:uncharacterized protein (TIGR02996 family)